jgi:methionyl-tRNA formyltransferase
MQSYRIIFMGSPEFALPTLAALAAQFPVVGVVTQPDRPAGRGRELTPPPVKALAGELGLPVIQPERLKDLAAMQRLQTWAPDVIIVAAFGQILRPAVLDLPRFGCVNVHASLLPRWRGAAPIQAAILNGDAETGITIMRMDPGVDTGPILSQQTLPISPDDTGASLSQRLADLGADLLIETLPDYLNGDIQPRPQGDADATYAPMLKKDDGRLDFSRSAEWLARQVRAYHPWPGTFMLWEGQPLKVLKAHAIDELADTAGAAGQITAGSTTIVSGLPAVRCAHGLLVIDALQPAGKRPMPGKVFLSGARSWGH